MKTQFQRNETFNLLSEDQKKAALESGLGPEVLYDGLRFAIPIWWVFQRPDRCPRLRSGSTFLVDRGTGVLAITADHVFREYCEANLTFRLGNVKILRGAWNEELFRVLEGFPDLAHDDEVDACSGALEMLNPKMNSWGLYELYRQQAEQLRAEKEGRPTTEPAKTNWAPGSMEWQAEQNKSD